MSDQFGGQSFDELFSQPSAAPQRDAAAPPSVVGYRGVYNALNPASETPHLVDYVRTIYKRRWAAITSFVIVLGSVAVYTFTTTPIYQAKTRLLIDAENPSVVNFKTVVDESQAKADYYQTQYNILQSRALARRTLEQLKLWGTAPFGGNTPQQFSLTGTAVQAAASAASGIASLFRTPEASDPNAVPAANETAAQSRAIDRFLSNLKIEPLRNSRLVDVKYELPDARLATEIANAVAKNYIDQNLEYKFLASKDANDWLSDRLTEQRKQVEEAESKLQQYREANDAISLKDRENIVVQRLSDLSAAVTQAKTDRLGKEALYEQLQVIRGNSTALDTFPAIIANGFIQQQKNELAQLQTEYAKQNEKLGPNHPDMLKLQSAIQSAQTKLETEIAKVLQGVRNDYQAAVAKEQNLTVALNAQKGDALAMNRKAIEYNVLARDVESSQQVFQSLLQRSKETGVSSELRTSNIRILDPAERPRSPAYPQRFTNLLVGALGGLLLAAAVVFFFEYVDARIKNPEEIRVHLGIPFLGLLPAVETKDQSEGYPLISNGVSPSFGEAFRAIRTNVVFSSTEQGPRSITVTSTGPGEGKSLVASNLAVALAQSSQRVLLIDGDMRKPSVHKVLTLSQEPGLSNILVGDAKASEGVRRTSIPGLWALPAGRIPPNPAELMGSPRFRSMLDKFRDHFDWVIIDSPPIMAVTDAALVAHHTNGVLFVVGSEMTNRHAAMRARDQLDQAHAKFIGAVLNRVHLNRHPYYYAPYYRSDYTNYYASAAS